MYGDIIITIKINKKIGNTTINVMFPFEIRRNVLT